MQIENQPNHTPAPWSLGRIEGWGQVVMGPEYSVARVLDVDVMHGKCNANLIAASPDLLEACKAMVGVCEGFPDIAEEPSVAECMSLARDAIAKATGGAA